jgi:hypothetical protein
LDGKRYVLLYLDHRVRHSVVEQLLLRCGATDFELYGLDNAVQFSQPGSVGRAQEWYGIIHKHFAEGDARASAWLRPGRMPSMLPAGRVVEIAAAGEGRGASMIPRPDKRVRADGGCGDGGASDEERIQQLLLAEQDARLDRALVEKDRRNESVLAERDRQHALALAAKDDALRAALLRVGSAEQRAAGAEARLALLEEEARMLAAAGGRVGGREVVLEVDLASEKKETAALRTQLEGLKASMLAKDALLLDIKQQCCERVNALENDAHTMRVEAGRWACDRELRTRGLEDKTKRLATATAEVRRLRAECGAKDVLIADLRRGALAIIKAEMEAERLHREEGAKATADMARKEAEFKEAVWKRKSAALHEEIDRLRGQLMCFVAKEQRR